MRLHACGSTHQLPLRRSATFCPPQRSPLFITLSISSPLPSLPHSLHLFSSPLLSSLSLPHSLLSISSPLLSFSACLSPLHLLSSPLLSFSLCLVSCFFVSAREIEVWN